MTRAQIADPEFANKVREGREDEIVHCIRGNQGCIGRVFKGLPIACTVNPGAGRERRFGPGTLVPGGAAGALARRRRRAGGDEGGRSRSPSAGTTSRSLERGGTARRPGEPDPAHARSRRVRLDHARPRVRSSPGSASTSGSGTEATLELVRELAPGRRRSSPPARCRRARGFSSVNPLVERLPGAEQDNVLTVWDVLLESRPVGKRVVVLDDDGTPLRRRGDRGAARPRLRGRARQPLADALPRRR